MSVVELENVEEGDASNGARGVPNAIPSLIENVVPRVRR